MEEKNGYIFTDEYGSFRMEHPERSSGLYFPLAGESGLKSCVTPLLGGDSKMDQNSFLLRPVSIDDLNDVKSTRNFWCCIADGSVWSATGASARTEALDGKAQEETVLDAGLMWHRMSRHSAAMQLSSVVTSFVPCDGRGGSSDYEVMLVTIRNDSDAVLRMTPVAAVPIYGRSADNLRDHRHVTSLLHRMEVTEMGVEVTPTLTFDERGHKKNELTYFVYGIELTDDKEAETSLLLGQMQGSETVPDVDAGSSLPLGQKQGLRSCAAPSVRENAEQENGRGPVSCCPLLQDFIGEGGSLARPLALEELYPSAGAENCDESECNGKRKTVRVAEHENDDETRAFRGAEPENDNATRTVRDVETGSDSESSFVGDAKIGRNGETKSQKAVVGETHTVWLETGTKASGGEAMGALRFAQCALAPGEARSYCICMGIARTEDLPAIRRKIRNACGSSESVTATFERTKQWWISRVNVRCETGDRNQDGFLYWVTFQPILRKIYGCSFLPYHDYGKGGRGWRDLWQDCLTLILMEPDGVREMLLDNYGGVRMDGTNATIIGNGRGEFLADRNHITRVWMDHGYWPFQTTELYIRQTGDLEILDEEVPYFKDRQVCRGEKSDAKWTEAQGTLQMDDAGNVATGSVLEHILVQNITAFYDVGAHNHIRLRGADWNDGLDMAVENGESVAFTSAYSGNLLQLAELIRRRKRADGGQQFMYRLQKELFTLLYVRKETWEQIEEKRRLLDLYMERCAHTVSTAKEEIEADDLAEILEKMGRWMQQHIRDTEWIQTPDGSFFNGYYDNHKNRLEGAFPDGVRMTLTGQVFPVMSGTATDEQVRQIVQAADHLLYSPSIGGYRLNTDFGEVRLDMGRAFGFAYGHKENGAVFSHMAVMYAYALYQRGFIREGYRVLHALYEQASDFAHSRIYPGLPEYFSDRGRGMYPYLTGSASWMMLTVITLVYGIKGFYGDLCLEPKLLDEQLDENGQIGIHLCFAGVPLHVRYEATERREIYQSVKAVSLDGERIEGNVIAKEKLIGENLAYREKTQKGTCLEEERKGDSRTECREREIRVVME